MGKLRKTLGGGGEQRPPRGSPAVIGAAHPSCSKQAHGTLLRPGVHFSCMQDADQGGTLLFFLKHCLYTKRVYQLVQIHVMRNTFKHFFHDCLIFFTLYSQFLLTIYSQFYFDYLQSNFFPTPSTFRNKCHCHPSSLQLYSQ